MGYTYLSLSSASFCPAGSEFMLRFPIIGQAYRYGLFCQLLLHDKEEFAKEVENMLNNYSFNHSVFAASIPFMHPTIQQLLYRLIRKCLKVMADEERRYDDRNRASHEEAKAIIEFLAENERYIPHI